MATIALIWELGSDYGHIGRFLPIALELKARGHRPVMILRDISRADEMLGRHGIEYLQAPLWLPPVQGLPAPINFTESLFLFGFLQPAGLLSVLRAWRALLALLKPDLLIFDHAPTALLASRGLGLPRLVTGNSFAVPPRRTPLPLYEWWNPKAGAPQRELDCEERLLRNANHALSALGAPPMTCVADLYDAEVTHITGAPELDVYGPRDAACYVGAINALDQGVEPRWPAGPARRVFAYLKPRYMHFDAVVTALARLDASVLVFAPGLARQNMLRLQAANLAFSTEPLRMRSVREQVEMAVCHAGGMVDVMLQAGRPVFLLPMQMEQTMTSRRVDELGCGLFHIAQQGPRELEKGLKRVFSTPAYAEHALAYQQRNANFTQAFAMERMIGSCEALLANAAR
ncbi:glycosyltransferase [Zoogloea sp.]|uniref:glycosyltransferase n=1 Tax=Zoogloea sp. TaxID=49181 RepID=UPI0035AEED23